MKRLRSHVRWLPLAVLVVIGVVQLQSWWSTRQINAHGEAERQRVLQRVRDQGIPVGFREWREQAEYQTYDQWVEAEWEIDPTKDRHNMAVVAGKLLWTASQWPNVTNAEDGRAWEAITDDERITIPHRPTDDDVKAVAAYVQRHRQQIELINQAEAHESIDVGGILMRRSAEWDFDEGLAYYSMFRALARVREIESLNHQCHGRGNQAMRQTLSMLRLADAMNSLPRNAVCGLVRLSVVSMAAHNVEQTLSRTEPDAATLRVVREALADCLATYEPTDTLRWMVAEHADYLSRPHEAFYTNAIQITRYIAREDEIPTRTYITATGEANHIEPAEPGALAKLIAWVGRQFGEDWGSSGRQVTMQATMPASRWRPMLDKQTCNLARRPGDIKTVLAQRTETWLDAYIAIQALPTHEAFREAEAQHRDDVYPQTMTRLGINTLCSLRQAIALIDIELYRREYGRWPDKPTELGTAWPIDGFDGKPMRYKRTDDGCIVYSIGNDLADDGGDDDEDLGMRMYDPAVRNSPMPPKPVEDEDELPDTGMPFGPMGP